MSARAQEVMAPALPQVNLLPPEVKAARGLARLKKWLALVVLLALVVCAGIVLLAMLQQKDAEDDLGLQQAETERLMAEQARYAEVPAVLGALDRALAAREVGMSTEILWRPYLQAIAATTPEGVRIENLRVQGATPILLPSAPTDALSAWSVNTITFTAQSLVLPDTETWLRALATVPGFANPLFSQATLTETDGVVHYNVSATVQVNEQAYALRFSAEAAAAAEATEEEE